MDKQNDGFNSHWAQDASSNDDYLNLMPDFDTLMANNPSILPTEWSFSQGNENYDYHPFTSDNYLEPGNFQQPQAQAQSQTQTQKPQPASSGFSNAHRGHAFSGFMEEDSATLMQNRLSKWHLNSHKGSLPQPGGAVDNASCRTSCDDGTCPSHCGETGQGTVCCDDNDCGASSLCVDEDCDGANHPCTDENCLSEASPQRVPAPGETTDEEPEGEEEEEKRDVAAAAALTSIGDKADHQPVNSKGHTRRLNTSVNLYTGSPSHGSSFQNTPSPSFSTTQSSMFTNTQTSPFPNQFGPSFMTPQGFHTGDCGHGFNPNMSSSDNQNSCFFENNAWQANPAFAFASHMFQYHAPGSGADHTGPCPMDNSNLSFSTCPLPLLSESNGFNDDMNLDLHPTCGFTFQDTEMFQEHVFSHHKELMESLPTTGPCNSFDLPFSQGPQNSYQPFLSGPRVSSGHCSGGHLHHGTHSMDMAFEPCTLQDTFNPTQTTSAKTETRSKTKPKSISKTKPKTKSKSQPSKSLESGQETDDEAGGPFGTIDPKKAPEEFPTLELKDGTKLRPLPASKLVQPEKPAECLWNDPKTGKTCGRWFPSAEALDAHCKDDHIDSMEKIEGGFVCHWDQCARKDKPAFGQKGKLVRHIQTHTACKQPKGLGREEDKS